MFKKTKLIFLSVINLYTIAGCNNEKQTVKLKSTTDYMQLCNKTSYYRNTHGNLSLDENYICEFDTENRLNKIYYISRRKCLDTEIKPSFCIYSIEYYDWKNKFYEICKSIWEKETYVQLPCKKLRR